MLLHTDSLPSGYKVIAEMDYIFDDQKLYIVLSKDEIVFVEKVQALPGEQEDVPGGICFFQTELPRAAAPWIVDVIENRLWKSEAEGGLPSGVNFVDEDVAGENLKIRRAMNVSGPGEKGFYFINFSRPSLHFETDNYQEIQITDKLLKAGGLLNTLKNISALAE